MNKLFYFLILCIYFPLSVFAELAFDIDSLKEHLKNNPKDYKTHVLLSRYYFDNNDLNQSIYHINKAKKIMPNAPEIKEVDSIVNQHNKDRELLKKYNLKVDDSHDKFFQVLTSLKQKDNLDEFEELLDYLMRKDEKLEDKFYLLSSEVMLQDKQLYKSRKLLEKASSLKKTSSYLKVEAKLCELESNFLCSAKDYEELYKLNRNEQEQLLATQMYLQGNDYIEASKVLNKIPKSLHSSKQYKELSNKIKDYQKNRLQELEKNYENRPNLKNLTLLCDTLHKNNLYKKVSKKLEEHYKRFGSTPEFNKYAGDISYWNADTDKAIFYYSKIQDSDAEIQYKLGRLLSWKTSYPEALNALDKAQDLDKDNDYYYDIYKAKAYIWLWSAEYAKSAKVFKELLKHFPEDKELQKAYKQATNYRDGKVTTKVVKHKRARVNHELQKATNLYDKNRYTESLGYFAYYLKKHPDDKLAKEKYAFALQKTQRYIEASNEYQDLYKTTNNIRFLHHSAYNLYRAQKYDEASKQYKEIISHYGSSDLDKLNVKAIDKNILMEYGDILENTGRTKEAKILYETTLQKYASVAKLSKEHTDFLNSWLTSWKSRNLQRYISHYTKRTDKWKQNKKYLFANNRYIDVNITAPRIIYTDAYKPKEILTIRFLQDYSSNKLTDRGFKELDLTCNSIGCLIKDERWSKANLDAIDKYALKRLKYIDSYNFKKKRKVSIKKEPKKAIPQIKKPKVIGDPIGNILKIEPKEKVTSDLNQTKVKVDDAQGYGYNAGLNARYFSDSDKRHYKGAMLKGGISLSENSTINGGIGMFSLREDFQRGSDTIDGNTFMLEYASKSWIIGTFLDSYLDKIDFSPYLIYKHTFNSNFVNYLPLTQYMQFKLYKRNLFASKLSTMAMRKDIDKYALNISDYMDFNRFSSLWFALDMAYITDENYILNFMFDYEIYKNYYRKFRYAFLLSGWYEHNKETKIEYYSPDFDDVTHLLLNVYYPIASDLDIKAQGGYGYNFNYERNILRYGLWLETKRYAKTKFKIGCLRSQILNETAITVDTLGYDFIDCKLDFNYNW